MLRFSGVNAPAKLEETGFVPLRGIGHDLGEQVKQSFVLSWVVNTGHEVLRYSSIPEEWSG